MGCESIKNATLRADCLEQERAKAASSGPSEGPTTFGVEGLAPVWAGVPVPRTWDQIYIDTSTPDAIRRASDPYSATYNVNVPRSEVPAFYSLPATEQAMFTTIAQKIHPLKTGASFYDEMIQASWDLSKNGIYRSPQALAWDLAQGGSLESKRKGGGYGAAAPQPADPSAVRRAMDSLARGLLGRTLSNREFRDYYKQYAAEFRGNPDVDMQQHGIESLQREGDYQEYQVATKFADAMKSVIQGVAT